MCFSLMQTGGSDLHRAPSSADSSSRWFTASRRSWAKLTAPLTSSLCSPQPTPAQDQLGGWLHGFGLALAQTTRLAGLSLITSWGWGTSLTQVPSATPTEGGQSTPCNYPRCPYFPVYKFSILSFPGFLRSEVALSCTDTEQLSCGFWRLPSEHKQLPPFLGLTWPHILAKSYIPTSPSDNGLSALLPPLHSWGPNVLAYLEVSPNICGLEPFPSKTSQVLMADGNLKDSLNPSSWQPSARRSRGSEG